SLSLSLCLLNANSRGLLLTRLPHSQSHHVFQSVRRNLQTRSRVFGQPLQTVYLPVDRECDHCSGYQADLRDRPAVYRLDALPSARDAIHSPRVWLFHRPASLHPTHGGELLRLHGSHADLPCNNDLCRLQRPSTAQQNTRRSDEVRDEPEEQSHHRWHFLRRVHPVGRNHSVHLLRHQATSRGFHVLDRGGKEQSEERIVAAQHGSVRGLEIVESQQELDKVVQVGGAEQSTKLRCSLDSKQEDESR
ncbi:hypothetical protein PENTCL1PPCAC_4264, partial [Pristionchus entomophagus]